MIGAALYEKRLRRFKGWPEREFVDEFARAGVPPKVATAVYEYYRSHSPDPLFTVAPTYSLWGVFRHSGEDVDDDAERIAKRLGLRLPPEAILREWPVPPATVRDMVMWVDWVRQHQPGARTQPESASGGRTG